MTPILPKTPAEPKVVNPKATTCANCGGPLGKLFYFDPPCWALVPGGEKAQLYAMHHRKQNTDSKVARCVRLIQERQARAKE